MTAEPKVWHLYMLRSEASGLIYTGIAYDVSARAKKHNSGKGAKFTARKPGPWIVVYIEVLTASTGDALRRERAVKKLRKPEKLALARSWKPQPSSS